MEQSLFLVLLYSLCPACFLIAGGLLAINGFYGHRFGDALQHFSVGVVFSAVALEFLPKVVSANAPWNMTIGFLTGLMLVISVRKLTVCFLQREREKFSIYLPRAALISTAIDLFIDGLLISVAFLAGTKGGLLITLALAVEELFLGLNINKLLKKNKVDYAFYAPCNIGLAIIILLGVALGYGLMQVLPLAATTFVLSFGMAAILFLVTEELLANLSTELETTWVTATFLLGFLLILIVETTT